MRQLIKYSSLNTLVIVLVVGGALVVFFPFFWMVLTSLKRSYEIYRKTLTFWPDSFFYFNNYAEVFRSQPFARFFLNSFIVTGGCVGASLFFSSLGGYAFAKFDFPAKEIIFFGFILSVLMVPIQALIVPLYRMFNSLGLSNTYLGIMGPSLISAFGVFLMRQFIETIPTDYIDAARIDGLSEFGIFFKIVLPLSKPALATLAVIKFFWTWNEFMWPLVIIHEENMKTVTLGLSYFSGVWHIEYTLVCTASFLSVIPILIIFIFLQKYVVKGMTMTGIKG